MVKQLVLVAAGMLLAASAARAQDEIRYYDRAKKTEVAVKGTISDETPAQITYKTSGGRTEKVSVADIILLRGTYPLP